MPAQPDIDDAPILVSVDFSEDSEAALAWAAEAARHRSAPLLVLHVVHDPAAAPGYYRSRDLDELRPMEEVGAELLEDFVRRMRAAIPDLGRIEVRTALIVGVPATRILEMAEKVRARMIVMGSTGRTGLKRLLLGSKAERVAQLAPMPVTIVKAADPEQARP